MRRQGERYNFTPYCFIHDDGQNITSSVEQSRLAPRSSWIRYTAENFEPSVYQQRQKPYRNLLCEGHMAERLESS